MTLCEFCNDQPGLHRGWGRWVCRECILALTADSIAADERTDTPGAEPVTAAGETAAPVFPAAFNPHEEERIRAIFEKHTL